MPQQSYAMGISAGDEIQVYVLLATNLLLLLAVVRRAKRSQVALSYTRSVSGESSTTR